LPRLKPKNAAVLGVSILDEQSKAKFADKYGLTFPLLADADHEVADKYGVWQEKKNYGKAYMGIVRTTYLIGPDGKVVERWDNVKVDGHAEVEGPALSVAEGPALSVAEGLQCVAGGSPFRSRARALSTSR
jgi:peroxiredoxin Q/BCP